MPGTLITRDTTEVNSPTIHPGWGEEYPAVSMQPELDGRKWAKRYGVYFKNRFTETSPFFPLKLLKHILTKEALSLDVNSIEGLNNGEKAILVGQVLDSGDSGTKTYIQIFAILKSIHQLERLPDFIREGASDQELPLFDYSPGVGEWPLQTQSRKPFPDYLLDADARFVFSSQQYKMIIPFFDDQSRPQDLSWAPVLPYYEVASEKAESYTIFARYRSMVSRILIHPHCHAFRNVFNALQDPDKPMFFAFKRSVTYNLDSFRKEVEMLQRFKKIRHPHIVTLLAAFTNVHNFLIFPWATYNLYMYWRDVRPTPDAGNIELVRWICHQSCMLVEAVSRIHDVPENEEIPEHERSYGRHGDLKPWNILWYESRQGFGKLVIADAGFTKLDRFNNMPYDPNTPRALDPHFVKMIYRSPELDYANDLMGRTVDIWALGCTFFEILLWLNRGYNGVDGLTHMQLRLLAPSIQGRMSNAYYEWVYVQGVDFYAVRLKDTVIEYIRILRKYCSQFTHDFLDIIEYQMLVIDHNERISAEKLLQEMKALHRKCIENQAYCSDKEQRQPCDTPKPKLQKREFCVDVEPLGKGKVSRIILGDDGSYVI